MCINQMTRDIHRNIRMCLVYWGGYLLIIILILINFDIQVSIQILIARVRFLFAELYS